MANFEQQRYVKDFCVQNGLLSSQPLNEIFIFFANSTNIRHLISFGNPLLDHSFRLENELLLMKYGLEREAQDEMSGEIIKAIIKDAHEM